MALQREAPGGWGWGSAQLGHTAVRCTVRLGLATAPLRPAALPADVGQEFCTGEAGVVWISACFPERKYGLSIVRSHGYVSRFHRPAGWEEVIWRVVSWAPLQTQGWLLAVTGVGRGGGDAKPATPGLSGLTHMCTGLHRWSLLSRKMGPDRSLPEVSFLSVWVGACLRWPVGEWRSDGVCHVCTCLLWQGGSYGILALKIKNTLEVSETHLGVVVQSLSCV